MAGELDTETGEEPEGLPPRMQSQDGGSSLVDVDWEVLAGAEGYDDADFGSYTLGGGGQPLGDTTDSYAEVAEEFMLGSSGASTDHTLHAAADVAQALLNAAGLGSTRPSSPAPEHGPSDEPLIADAGPDLLESGPEESGPEESGPEDPDDIHPAARDQRSGLDFVARQSRSLFDAEVEPVDADAHAGLVELTGRGAEPDRFEEIDGDDPLAIDHRSGVSVDEHADDDRNELLLVGLFLAGLVVPLILLALVAVGVLDANQLPFSGS